MLHAPSRVAIRATAKALTPEAALIRRCLRAGEKRQPAIWRNVRTPMTGKRCRLQLNRRPFVDPSSHFRIEWTGLEIVAIPLWLSSQLVWPVPPASAGLARSTCPSAPPVALEKGRRTDMDPSFPHTLRYGDGRTPGHEVPTDTSPEKPPTLADCSGAPAVQRRSPPRSPGRGCRERQKVGGQAALRFWFLRWWLRISDNNGGMGCPTPDFLALSIFKLTYVGRRQSGRAGSLSNVFEANRL
jgi:hypothetical protein